LAFEEGVVEIIEAAGALKLKDSVIEISGVKLTFLSLTFWFMTLT
jgi:hypothetical protein